MPGLHHLREVDDVAEVGIEIALQRGPDGGHADRGHSPDDELDGPPVNGAVVERCGVEQFGLGFGADHERTSEATRYRTFVRARTALRPSVTICRDEWPNEALPSAKILGKTAVRTQACMEGARHVPDILRRSCRLILGRAKRIDANDFEM